MPELRSRRRGILSTNAGLSIALGACLCAGSLIGAGPTTAASAPAAPSAPVTVTAPATPQLTLVASTSTAAAKRKAKRAKIIAEARKHRGKPYRYGAAGPARFDCSGFVKYVMRKAIGKNLPHKANSQKNYGRWVPRNQAQPGDLVFFKNGNYAYHVGIYAGNGYMFDSPSPGKTVGKHKIWTKSYSVRRIV